MGLNLAQRLLEVQKELGWIAKRGENKQQGYDFVRAVDVFDAARDAMHKHGVLWTWSTTAYDIAEVAGKAWHKMSADFAFYNVDDPKDKIISTVVGSSSPPGDKGAWVTITGMMKYALIQALLLPTGDDPEAQPETAERKPGATAPTNPPSSPLAGDVKNAPAVKVGLTEPQRKKLFARFDELGLTVTESKRFVIKELTGKHSTKEMSSADLDKILDFFKDKSDATDEMVVKAMAAA